MAPSRTRSPRMPSLWAATFEITCYLKSQQRLPIEVKAAKVLVEFDATDIILKSEGSTPLLNPKPLSLPQSMATDIHLLGLSIEPLSVAIISITQSLRLTSLFRPPSKSNHSFPKTKSSQKQSQAWSLEGLALSMAGG